MKTEEKNDFDYEMTFDVYRSLILCHYMKRWGAPKYRHVVNRAEDGTKFELYFFPCAGKIPIVRWATVGVAHQRKEDGMCEGKEYFMVLPRGQGGASQKSVANYLIDLSAHIIKNTKRFDGPRVFDESDLAPKKWKPKAILIDEATGEDEDFSNPVGVGDVEILWLVPLFQSEVNKILNDGIEAFDKMRESQELSIVDINRSAFV